MDLRRAARLHQTAGVTSSDYWEFHPGQRVMTPEGFPGVVAAVEDGPFPGSEQYVVELDAGMGGGEYSGEELRELPGGVQAGLRASAVSHAEIAALAVEQDLTPETDVEVEAGGKTWRGQISAAQESAISLMLRGDEGALVGQQQLATSEITSIRRVSRLDPTEASVEKVEIHDLGDGMGLLPPPIQGGSWNDRPLKNFGLYVDDKSVGVAQVYEPTDDDPRAIIGWINITEPNRRKGIASTVFRYLQDKYGEVGYDSLTDLGEKGWRGKQAKTAAAEPPYPKLEKCEGTSRTPDYVGRKPFSGPAEGRCQREPTHWSEEKYAWLCDEHDRGWKKREAAVEVVTAADDYPELGDILIERPPLEHAQRVGSLDRKNSDNKYGCRYCGAYKTPERDAAGLWWCRECKEPLECDECGQQMSARHEHRTAESKLIPVFDADTGGNVTAGIMDKWMDYTDKRLPADRQFKPGTGEAWSYDWCRFRKRRRCMYPKTLNADATQQAGYAVWVPEDRGLCPRDAWDDQKSCPVSEPGPHSGEPNALLDATISWEEGGQRGGIPTHSVLDQHEADLHEAAYYLDDAEVTKEQMFDLLVEHGLISAEQSRPRDKGDVRRLVEMAQPILYKEWAKDPNRWQIRTAPYTAPPPPNRDVSPETMEWVRDQKSAAKPADDAEYRKAYERGWKSTNLEAGDARNEPEAWYDGYVDAAAGREKWHTYHCRQAGGCEEHEWGSKTAARVPFEFTARWTDVRSKAKRIRTEGGVRIIAAPEGHVGGSISAEVRGDTNIYQTTILREPGKTAVASWECGCAWSAYSWGRSGRWKKYEGRMCSHALALVFEAQAQGMFGRSIQEQPQKPPWRMDPTIPVVQQYEPKTNGNSPWRVGSKTAGFDVPPGHVVVRIDSHRAHDKLVRMVLGGEAPQSYFDLEHPQVYVISQDAFDKAQELRIKGIALAPKNLDLSKYMKTIRMANAHPVSTDGSLAQSPAAFIAQGLLGEGMEPNDVVATLIDMGMPNAPGIFAEAASGPLKAKVRGWVRRILTLLPHGQVEVEGIGAVDQSQVYYPSYDPRLGLDFHDSTPHISAFDESEHPRDNDGQFTAKQAASELIKKARDNESRVSPALQRVAQEVGGKLEGFDFRLKEEGRLADKIEGYAKKKGIDAKQAMAGINDVLRYTVAIPTDDYSKGVGKAVTALQGAGLRMRANGFKNYWQPGDPYQGINAVFETRDGFPIEVQFHTPQSYRHKEDNHPLYAIMENRPGTDSTPEKRKSAWKAMSSGAMRIPQPAGAISFGGDIRYEPLSNVAFVITAADGTYRYFAQHGDNEAVKTHVWRFKVDDDVVGEYWNGARWVQDNTVLRPLIFGGTNHTEISEADAKRLMGPGAVKQSKTAAEEADTGGVMVCIVPPERVRKALSDKGDEPVDQMHVTLAYLGKTGENHRDLLIDAVSTFAAHYDSLIGEVSGYGVFHNNSADAASGVLYASVDVPGLDRLRADLVQYLKAHAFPVREDHGFTPHLTLQYFTGDEGADVGGSGAKVAGRSNSAGGLLDLGSDAFAIQAVSQGVGSVDLRGASGVDRGTWATPGGPSGPSHLSDGEVHSTGASRRDAEAEFMSGPQHSVYPPESPGARSVLPMSEGSVAALQTAAGRLEVPQELPDDAKGRWTINQIVVSYGSEWVACPLRGLGFVVTAPGLESMADLSTEAIIRNPDAPGHRQALDLSDRETKLRVSDCKHCGHAIAWKKSKAGKWYPCEVTYKQSYDERDTDSGRAYGTDVDVLRAAPWQPHRCQQSEYVDPANMVQSEWKNQASLADEAFLFEADIVSEDIKPGDPRLSHLMGGGKASMEQQRADNVEIASMAKRYLKEGMKAFTPAQQAEIIGEGEGVVAANFDRLDLTGTHYEALEAALAAEEDDEEWMLL